LHNYLSLLDKAFQPFSFKIKLCERGERWYSLIKVWNRDRIKSVVRSEYEWRIATWRKPCYQSVFNSMPI